MRYARGILDSDKPKYQIALDAGFSESTARVPKLIENKKGFHIAMAYLAGEMAHVTMKMLHELKSRDMDQIPFTELLGAVDRLSKVYARFTTVNSK